MGRGIDDAYTNLLGLLECPSIRVLDISDNHIDDERILEEVIYKMPNLSVLYMQGNPFTKKLRSYRKTVTVALPDLKYLDDKPVFEDDRRYAEAFVRGGFDEEREERKRFKAEKDEKHWKNHEAFKAMIGKAREEKKIADEAKKIVQS
jgi:dynein assembly factor 1